MKEAMGGISIFQIVIVFILLFTGIMCLTINHSKAFGVKDETIHILENSTGNNGNKLSDDTVSSITNYLKESGYRTTGRCPSEEWVGYARNGEENNNEAAFCIRAVDVASAYEKDAREKCRKVSDCEFVETGFPSMIYYDLVLFYQLDIPIINNIMNFELRGSTKVIFG